MPSKPKVATYHVTYDDGSTEWIFVDPKDEPPQPGDLFEDDPRVVQSAVFQDESGDPAEGDE